MTPANKGRTVAIANSVDFITDLRVAPSSGKIARRYLRRTNECGEYQGAQTSFARATLGIYSETNPRAVRLLTYTRQTLRVIEAIADVLRGACARS
jgi:hypothetical protein